MHEAARISCIFLVIFAFDLFYKSGQLNAGERRQETRSSVEIDLMAIGLSLGTLLGTFLVGLTGIENQLLGIIVVLTSSVAGFFGVALIGDKLFPKTP